MSATPEEIAAENAMYDRLTNTVTEALLTLPTKDLNQWNFRAGLFSQVDKIIGDVLESAKGRPQIGRFYLCLLLYRIVARFLDPINKEDCGQTDGAFAREAMARMEKVVAGKAKPVGVAGAVKPVAKVPGRTTGYYHAARAKMTPEELAADRVKRAEAMRRFRAKRKAKKAAQEPI